RLEVGDLVGAGVETEAGEVHDRAEVPELDVRRVHRRFPDLPLFAFAVAEQDVCPGRALPESSRQGQPDTHRESDAERPRGGFDEPELSAVGMPLQWGSEPPERV